MLIDGNRFRSELDIPYTCIIGGDGKMAAIAAASILAKTARDQFMAEVHEQYPDYNWQQNKGYPTKAHRAVIEKIGLSPLHRKSFRQLATQLEIDL